MHPFLTSELVALRRDELLNQAERARSAFGTPGRSRARARTTWRSSAGFVLVRLGMRLAGRAFDEPVVVIRRQRAGEQASVALIWSPLDKAA